MRALFSTEFFRVMNYSVSIRFRDFKDAEENMAPKIENTSPSEVVAKVGEEIDLFCLAKGVPTPTYK